MKFHRIKLLKILVIMFILVLVQILSASTIVAKVGNKKITFDQLAQEMRNLEEMENLSYTDLRQIALENLIESELLLTYAEQNSIIVSEEELDSFFMEQLGDLPRFQTEGLFDFEKYENFKTTATGLKILKEMEREIRIRKAETLIKTSFKLTDDVLLKEYIIQNAEIDISYAIVDVEKANVTNDFTADEATDFFYNNRELFKSKRKVKYHFFIVPHDEFLDSAASYYELVSQRLIPEDSLYTEIQLDSLKQIFLAEETRKRSIKVAQKEAKKWENYGTPQYYVMHSTYLAENESQGSLPAYITNMALDMEIGTISEPIDIGIGYLVFKVENYQEPQFLEIGDNPEFIWNQYVSYRKEKFHESQFHQYFSKNIDDFIIPVAVVEIVKLRKPVYRLNQRNDTFIATIKEELQKQNNNIDPIFYLEHHYNLEKDNLVIMLEKFSNQDSLKDNIAKLINQGKKEGFITSDKHTYYYSQTTYFPEYIPRYSDIKDQIRDVQFTNEMNEKDYETFFEEHKKEFQTPDSLQLGGVYFLTASDTLSIDSTMVYEYYRDNLDSYYRDKSVEFDYIALKDRASADLVRRYLVEKVDFDLVRFTFSSEVNLERNSMKEYSQLPPLISEALLNIESGEISQPLEYEGKWIILKKIRVLSEGVREYREVKNDIATLLLSGIVDERTYLKAKTIFDSTVYYSQAFAYADSGNMFKTSYQSIDKEFEIIGDISDYADELKRFWRNEKYSSIIKLPENKGYATVYILKKKSSVQMEFEEALPIIKNIFTGRKSFETAKNYINHLREEIADGSNPEMLFYFIGGWKREQNIDLNSNIFGPEWSRLILEDIANHEEGYFSPVLNLSEKKLLIYQINRLKRIPREQFNAEKEEFKSTIIDNKFRSWLEVFRTRIGVDINL